MDVSLRTNDTMRPNADKSHKSKNKKHRDSRFKTESMRCKSAANENDAGSWNTTLRSDCMPRSHKQLRSQNNLSFNEPCNVPYNRVLDHEPNHSSDVRRDDYFDRDLGKKDFANQRVRQHPPGIVGQHVIPNHSGELETNTLNSQQRPGGMEERNKSEYNNGSYKSQPRWIKKQTPSLEYPDAFHGSSAPKLPTKYQEHRTCLNCGVVGHMRKNCKERITGIDHPNALSRRRYDHATRPKNFEKSVDFINQPSAQIFDNRQDSGRLDVNAVHNRPDYTVKTNTTLHSDIGIKSGEDERYVRENNYNNPEIYDIAINNQKLYQDRDAQLVGSVKDVSGINHYIPSQLVYPGANIDFSVQPALVSNVAALHAPPIDEQQTLLTTSNYCADSNVIPAAAILRTPNALPFNQSAVYSCHNSVNLSATIVPSPPARYSDSINMSGSVNSISDPPRGNIHVVSPIKSPQMSALLMTPTLTSVNTITKQSSPLHQVASNAIEPNQSLLLQVRKMESEISRLTNQLAQSDSKVKTFETRSVTSSVHSQTLESNCRTIDTQTDTDSIDSSPMMFTTSLIPSASPFVIAMIERPQKLEYAMDVLAKDWRNSAPNGYGRFGKKTIIFIDDFDIAPWNMSNYFGSDAVISTCWIDHFMSEEEFESIIGDFLNGFRAVLICTNSCAGNELFHRKIPKKAIDSIIFYDIPRTIAEFSEDCKLAKDLSMGIYVLYDDTTDRRLAADLVELLFNQSIYVPPWLNAYATSYEENRPRSYPPMNEPIWCK